MQLVRIGDKIISRDKLYTTIEDILALRAAGYAQQEVATRLNIDRTFISRLESLGEVRKGRKIAVIGFPILNKEEVINILRQEGIEYFLIMSEKERWAFVSQKTGIDLFNKIMEILGKIRTFDAVIIIGSNKRIKIIKALLDNEVLGLEIGESPLEEDKMVDPEEIGEIVRALKRIEGTSDEKSC